MARGCTSSPISTPSSCALGRRLVSLSHAPPRRAPTRPCRRGTSAGRWSAGERAGRPARDLSIATEPQLRLSGRGRARSVPRATRREPLLLLAVLEDAPGQRAWLRRHGSLEAEPRARRDGGLRRALRAARG